ncbi:MAG: hypothetical protein ABIP38_14080, partial [Steroidobacteraceae bacterium]
DADITWRDAGSGADWHLSELAFSARLPEDLAAPTREFHDIELVGRLAGGPIAAGGVQFGLQVDAARTTPELLQVPVFNARWSEAVLSGAVDARLVAPQKVDASLAVQVPSLRALLATVGITPPPMADPMTLGPLQGKVALHYAAGAAVLDNLALSLDDTNLTGELALPGIDPLALRFTLDADRVDLDRYMTPADMESKPLELPLAALKTMDAKGVLRIRSATVAGAAAKDVRIDVE